MAATTSAVIAPATSGSRRRVSAATPTAAIAETPIMTTTTNREYTRHVVVISLTYFDGAGKSASPTVTCGGADHTNPTKATTAAARNPARSRAGVPFRKTSRPPANATARTLSPRHRVVSEKFDPCWRAASHDRVASPNR